MTISRSEDLLVGLVALGVIPWILWTIRRGLRDGRLPIGRTYVSRDERPGKYNGLLLFYGVALLFVAALAMNLLFGLDVGIRS